MAREETSLVFTTRGNIELLSQNKMALFASRQTPENMVHDILLFFDLLKELPIGLSGGWQSPLEKRLYKRMTISQKANVLHYYARELNHITLTSFQEELLSENKLLMLAPETRLLRPSKKMVARRDALIFSQNKKVCFLYIHSGGKLEKYYNALLSSGHEVFIMEHEQNRPYYADHVIRLNSGNLEILTFGK